MKKVKCHKRKHTNEISERIGRRICSLVLPSESNSQYHSLVSTFAPCDPLICFEKYILACSIEGQVYLFSVLDFSDDGPPQSHVQCIDPKNEEIRLASIQNDTNQEERLRQETRNSLLPIAAIDLNRDHNSNSNDKRANLQINSVEISITIINSCAYSFTSENGENNSIASSCSNVDSDRQHQYIILLSCEGNVFIVEVIDSNDDDNENGNVSLILRTTFHVGPCGATALCVASSLKRNRDYHEKKSPLPSIIIYTAHESGIIVSYEVPLPHINQCTESDQIKRHRPKLLWKGSFFNAAIHSISTWSEKTNLEYDSFPFLMVELHAWKFCVTSTDKNDEGYGDEDQHNNNNGTIEVLNILSLQSIWHENNSKGNFIDLISLDDYCVWPGSGMEIADPNIHHVWDKLQKIPITSRINKDRTNNFKEKQTKQKTKDQLNAMNGNESNFVLHEVTKLKSICSDKWSDVGPAIAIATTSGLIALSHCSSNKVSQISTNNDSSIEKDIKESNSQFEWGIKNDANQWILPHPCVGIGSFHLNSVEKDEVNTCTSHIACCLKGGTVYLIPVISQSNKSSSYNSISDIIICHCPVESDGSDDGCIRFIHGFTAGNLLIKKWNRQKRTNISSSFSSLRRKSFKKHSNGIVADMENVVDQTCQLNDDAINCTKFDNTTYEVFHKVPILVYCWGAGIMDIYSCDGFNTQCKSSELKKGYQVIDALYQNGSIAILVSYLRTCDEEQIPISKVWKNAWHECRNSTVDMDSMIESIKIGNQFEQIRNLLLCISNGKER